MADTAMQKTESNGNGLATSEVTRGLTYTPRVDILETEEELLLYADLPGVNDGDVDIRFENGELTLHARRPSPPIPDEPWLWEAQAGDFFRSFRITERIDAGKISAELRQGVLTLHLPKAETAKPRKIAVKAG
jgi:HSP20 family protein